MIDLHCHILPSADDGPQGLSESISMARSAVEDGIHTIIATPHALGATFPNPPDKIRKAVAALQKHFEDKNIPIDLHPGSEVHLCPDMGRRILAGEALFLCENRRYILVEFPFDDVPQRFVHELCRLRQHDITPVIAHPERNPMVFYETKILDSLISMGCLIQLNSTSITGGFGESVAACAHQLLKLRKAHIIASDAHSADHRPPALSLSVKIAGDILGDTAEAMQMVKERPEKILAGDPIT